MTLSQTAHSADWPRDERRLFRALAADPGRVVTKQELLGILFPDDRAATTRRVDELADRLRARIAADTGQRAVANIWGVGYRLAT